METINYSNSVPHAIQLKMNKVETVKDLMNRMTV